MNRRILVLAPLFGLLAACASQPAATSASVADTIARDPQLSILKGLVARAGMTDMLRTGGPFTVFAPTDEAFKAVPAKTLDELAANPALLKSVLAYHVLPAAVMAQDVRPGNMKTAQGANLALARAGAFVTVEDAMVQVPDIVATNGVVHKVDRVLMPPKN